MEAIGHCNWTFLHRLLISIGVKHTFLQVVFGFSSGYFCSFGVFILWSTYGHCNYCVPVILFWLGIRRILCPCFDDVCSSQALLLHCFVCLLRHIATILQREKVYSLEFTNTSVRCGLSISFWEEKELLTMTNAHCG